MSDVTEVTSSGTLHFGFTPQTLFEPHESRPWNPLIASVFYRRGIIEAWGQGTLRMAVWAAEAGLPRPEILEIPGAVVVRFRARAPGKAETTEMATGKRRGNAGETLGKTPRDVLRLLRERPELSTPELAENLGKSQSAIERAIKKLREAGLLVRVGPDKGGSWKVNE